MQFRPVAIRSFQTSSSAKVPIVHSSSSLIESRTATDSCDLFFPCGDQSASAAAKDFQRLSVAFNSFLSKFGTNFELEVTSTLLMTAPPVEGTSLDSVSYKYNLMLSRGASFSH